MKNKIYQQAITEYGKEVVQDVIAIVSMSDPDGAHTQFEDLAMYVHAECVEFLYFMNEEGS